MPKAIINMVNVIQSADVVNGFLRNLIGQVADYHSIPGGMLKPDPAEIKIGQ